MQTRFNARMGQLPVHQQAKPPADPLLAQGAGLLAKAAGLAQFYDRDAKAEMAKAGMEGFQRYLIKPDSRKEVLERLEAVRKRVHR